MCRLSAITAQFPQRIDTLDRMMLVAQTDENQSDGCGISDGRVVYKSVLAYSSTVLGLFSSEEYFQETDILMGHVRKASTYTGRTRDESHPYTFTTKHGKVLVAAHNGYVIGSGVHVKGNPDTDSWRAFNRLVNILNETETGELTSGVVEEWLKEYDRKSTIAFLIHYDNSLYAFRHNKPLHAMAVGNGYVINTSKNVLHVINAWLRARHGVIPEDIFEIPEDALLRFYHNDQVIEKTDLDVKYYTAFAQPATAIQVSSKSSETATAQTGTAPETTGSSPPLSTALAVITPMDVIDLRKLTPRSMLMKTAANPMRGTLFLYWLQTSMNISSEPDMASIVCSISDDDLNLFLAQIGSWSSRQKRLINIWNRLVERGKDIKTHDEIFGPSWFWLDPFFIALDITDEVAEKRLIEELTGKEAK